MRKPSAPIPRQPRSPRVQGRTGADNGRPRETSVPSSPLAKGAKTRHTPARTTPQTPASPVQTQSAEQTPSASSPADFEIVEQERSASSMRLSLSQATAQPADEETALATPSSVSTPDRASSGQVGAGVSTLSDQPRQSVALFSRHSPARIAQASRDAIVSTGLTERLAERKRAVRKLRRRRLMEIAAALLVVAVAVWAVLFSPLLALRSNRITVTGLDGTVSQAQVREALQPYVGTSLLRLDVSHMGRDVEKKLVRVRTARVTRSWIHGAEVSLTMRVPVATYQTSKGYEVLDGDAVVLETVAQAPEGLATITPESGGSGLTASQVTAVATVMGCLDKETRAQVASASASNSGLVTLALTNGASVRWGDADELELKAQVLKVLLTTKASVYDVSSPRSPTTS